MKKNENQQPVQTLLHSASNRLISLVITRKRLDKPLFFVTDYREYPEQPSPVRMEAGHFFAVVLFLPLAPSADMRSAVRVPTGEAGVISASPLAVFAKKQFISPNRSPQPSVLRPPSSIFFPLCLRVSAPLR